MYDLLIADGTVVDPSHGLHGRMDVAVEKGRVVDVAEGLSRRGARRVVAVSGLWVLPGLVDSHVHVSSRPEGYRMMARAGVSCALDMAGQLGEIIQGLQGAGAGINVGFLYPLIPGETLSGRQPSQQEIGHALDLALDQGALGVKILGGHYPLSPEATAGVIEEAHRVGSWCAMHVGTTATGSNIQGLEEAIALAGGLPLHIAHVNSYCRGQITRDPLLEASRALRALAQAPATRSESYLSPWNGTSAQMQEGAPKSRVTRTCLLSGGYSATAAGMEEAIAAGWARIHGVRGDEIVLLPPAQGLETYHSHESRVNASFPVNPSGAAIALAIARSDGYLAVDADKGKMPTSPAGEAAAESEDTFVVNALSTDGGGIPRNTTLDQGLALVRFGAITIEDLIRKACLNPAKMLGLYAKGHLGPGADADVIVVDPDTHKVSWSFVGGQTVVREEKVVGEGGQLVTTERGRRALTKAGLPHTAVIPSWLG